MDLCMVCYVNRDYIQQILYFGGGGQTNLKLKSLIELFCALVAACSEICGWRADLAVR